MLLPEYTSASWKGGQLKRSCISRAGQASVPVTMAVRHCTAAESPLLCLAATVTFHSSRGSAVAGW